MQLIFQLLAEKRTLKFLDRPRELHDTPDSRDTTSSRNDIILAQNGERRPTSLHAL